MGTPRIDKLERNLMINGGLDFWQRDGNLSSGSELSGYNSVDRFQITTFNTSGTRQSAQQSGDVPNETGSDFSGLLSFDSTGTSTFDIKQRIEADNCRHVAGGKVSFSFWYKTDEFQDIRIRILKATGGKDNYSTTGSVYDQTFTADTSSIWKKLTIEGIDIDSDATNGLEVIITGDNPLNGSGNRFFRYAQIMLNQGEVVGEFSRAGRNIAEELILCQRYYEKSYPIGTKPGSALISGDFWYAVGYIDGTRVFGTAIDFRVRKRTTPSVTIYNDNGSSGQATFRTAGNTEDVFSTANANTERLSFTSNSGQLSAAFSNAGAGYGAAVGWEADAEL